MNKTLQEQLRAAQEQSWTARGLERVYLRELVATLRFACLAECSPLLHSRSWTPSTHPHLPKPAKVNRASSNAAVHKTTNNTNNTDNTKDNS